MRSWRALVQTWNRTRPWWWRVLLRGRPDLMRLGWEVAAGNTLQLPRRTPGVEVQVHGEGHHIVVEDGAVLRNVRFDVVGKGHVVRIAAGCVLNGVQIRLRGEGQRLLLAPKVRFTRGGEIWMEDRGGTLAIDEGVTIVQARLSVIEGTRLHIGPGSMLAYEIDIRTGDSHSLVDAATGRRLNPSADVDIGERVWIGARALILKGARVPADSVVAAAAVVTGAFRQPGVVLAGHPARVVRTGIRWQRERLPVPDAAPASDAEARA